MDRPDESARVVERYGLPFLILSDVDRRVVRSYGLLHAGGGPKGTDIAIPALFLIDQDRRITWRHVAGRIQDRPDPQVVLEEARQRVGPSWERR